METLQKNETCFFKADIKNIIFWFWPSNQTIIEQIECFFRTAKDLDLD